MGTRYRYTAYDEDRVRRAIEASNEYRRPGAVIASETLILEDLAVAASGWSPPTPAELRFVRSLVGEMLASREERVAR